MFKPLFLQLLSSGKVDEIAANPKKEDGLQRANRLTSAQYKNTWTRRKGGSRNWTSVRMHWHAQSVFRKETAPATLPAVTYADYHYADDFFIPCLRFENT